MSDWRLRQHFGYGVAKVALAPEPASAPSHVPPRFADALAALAGEVRADGFAGSARKTITTIGTGLVGGVLALLVFLMLARDFQEPDLEIVRFEPEPVPELAAPPPAPVVPAPEIPEPAPPPVVAETPPPPEPEPLPEPEPPKVVKRPPPPPPRPEMPAAPPPEPTLARMAPPRPAPPPPPSRPRPPVRIDAVSKPAPAPAPAPSLARSARPETARAKKIQPDLSVDPVAPKEFKVARSARTSPAPRRAPSPRRKPSVAPSLAPAPVATADPGPAPTRSARSTRVATTAPRPSKRPSASVPSFAAAPAPAPPRSASPARPVRPDPVREVARAETRRADPGDDISGVALGTLAACLSDREEDRLKLAVMEAAENRAECRSRNGRYRFVETKNLNAFLMWIERPESSAPGDRCMELGLALDCLRDRGRRGADRR